MRIRIKIGKEHIKFFTLLGIVLVLTPFLMDILIRSWNTEFVQGISNGIKTINKSGTSVIINVVIGFLVGSIGLLFVDRYKRIQAILLSIGIIIVSIYISKYFDVSWNVLIIAIGIGIGVYLGARSLKIKREFREAANNLSLFSTCYVILSFVIIYTSTNNTSNFIKDAFVVLAFSYFFGKLMNYESEGTNIFVLGPANSGKTTFFAGCYLRALEMTEIPLSASDDLLNLSDELHNGNIPWPERTKAAIYVYQFTYETGVLFPRKTKFRTIDYPGIFIENLNGYLYKKIDNKKMSEEEKKYVRTTQEIDNADTLIFLVDGEKYPHFGEMGIIHYIKIITKLREKGKNVKPYIVVTKSDLFMEEFGNKEDYPGFKKFIEDKFSQNIYMKQLLNEASDASFYPVFYYTKKTNENDGKDGNEKLIPIRDESGNVYTYGFDKFMNGLMELA